MNKNVVILLLALMLGPGALAQRNNKRAKYEFYRNLPVYADSLLKDL